MELSHNTVGKTPLKLLKSELRSEYSEKRKTINPEEKQAFDTAICRKILGLASYRYADTVLLYAPLRYEIDVSAVAENALAAGKRVAYPRCIPNSPTMKFHLVSSTDELFPGAYGIREPLASAPVWTPQPNEKAVCLLPGILYGRDGHRIGYGKGYYDRYFSDKQVLKIGVTYSEFILPKIPSGRFDLAADVLVSEKQILTVDARR